MLFNSIDFAVFFPVVFFLYWFVFKENLKRQNLLIVLASYVFYGWWDWRFLSLILFSTVLDFSIGLKLKTAQKQSSRRLLLWLSIFVNLGFLGFFKYFNFFQDNFKAAFSFFGQSFEGYSLSIILPVGISFYTFQTLSYTIDVYKKKLEASNDFISFAAFVSFFPQLVAGPIERAKHLLPQFYQKRTFSYDLAVSGLRQILWGFFKKIVIADNAAQIVNTVFSQSEELNGVSLLLGSLFFTFQIYGDFSGYSDIAIGTARLFGFDLMKNFAFPYFSRDIAEFWRRWHISLSTWFRDYLYIPLGGSKGSQNQRIRNTFIIFIVSGFWHGANWTFIFWGALNALYFLPLLLTKKNRTHLGVIAENGSLPSLREFFGMILTFFLTVIAWIFFRSNDLNQAFAILGEVFSPTLFSYPNIPTPKKAIITGILILALLFVEWFGRRDEFAIEKSIQNLKTPIRYGFYLLLSLLILWYSGSEQEFIYFQF